MKSISVSPVLTTVPPLDDLAPLYFDDLTPEQHENGVTLTATVAGGVPDGTYTITLTPTETWYVVQGAAGDMGEPFVDTVTASDGSLYTWGTITEDPNDAEKPAFTLDLYINPE